MDNLSQLGFRDGSIAYSVSGKGSAVVFLHGFLENLGIWNDLSHSLKNQYKVICIDLPGHGNSSNFGYCHTMELMADVVIHVLKILKIRRYYLIGHSMGGYVAMAIAEKRPDSIKGLCMFHSTASNDSDEKRKERQKVIKVVQKDKMFFIRTAIPNLFGSPEIHQKKISKIIDSAIKISTQGIIAALEGMRMRADREIVLKFVSYPVLYIIGRKDKLLPEKKLIQEAQLPEISEHVLLENSAHMGFIEEFQVCLKVIKQFLKR